MKISVVGLFLLCAVTLSGCTSETIMLVNPRTGASVKCSAAGSGLMAGAAAGWIEECLRRYEPQGYVTVERLTPAERDDLERRGVLRQPETPRGMMF